MRSSKRLKYKPSITHSLTSKSSKNNMNSSSGSYDFIIVDGKSYLFRYQHTTNAHKEAHRALCWQDVLPTQLVNLVFSSWKLALPSHQQISQKTSAGPSPHTTPQRTGITRQTCMVETSTTVEEGVLEEAAPPISEPGPWAIRMISVNGRNL